MELAVDGFLSEISEDAHVWAQLKMFILVCPLEIKETCLHVVFGFSLVHSLQRNFLSDVCVNESVHTLESKGYNHPRKT